MAGIDHDHRPRIAGCAAGAFGGRAPAARRRGRSLGCRARALHRKLSRSVAAEFEHQPRRLAVGGVEHIGFGDPRRPGQVEHDPRAAGHHQAVAERLDQPAAGSRRPWAEAENSPAGYRPPPGRDRRAQRRGSRSCRDRGRSGFACASPASRTSDATGKSSRAAAAVARPAGGPTRHARRKSTPRKTQLCARTAIDSTPARPLTAIELHG